MLLLYFSECYDYTYKYIIIQGFDLLEQDINIKLYKRA